MVTGVLSMLLAAGCLSTPSPAEEQVDASAPGDDASGTIDAATNDAMGCREVLNEQFSQANPTGWQNDGATFDMNAGTAGLYGSDSNFAALMTDAVYPLVDGLVVEAGFVSIGATADDGNADASVNLVIDPAGGEEYTMWVRDEIVYGSNDVLMPSDEACSVPGCPSLAEGEAVTFRLEVSGGFVRFSFTTTNVQASVGGVMNTTEGSDVRVRVAAWGRDGGFAASELDWVTISQCDQ